MLVHRPLLDQLDPGGVRAHHTSGGYVVDVRPVADYAAEHIPGSVSIPLRAQYATWLGWLLPPDVPIVVVRNPDQDPADILWPALNVGYTITGRTRAGESPPGPRSGGSVASTRLVGPATVDSRVVVDVRQATEHTGGHLPGAELIELGRLAEHAADMPAGSATVMCGHGERAATGASLLERAGRSDVAILLDAGPEEWAAATGRALETVR